jgi:hypothetical protein
LQKYEDTGGGKMKRFLIFIIGFSMFVALTIPTSSRQFEYPANNDKSFANENGSINK